MKLIRVQVLEVVKMLKVNQINPLELELVKNQMLRKNLVNLLKIYKLNYLNIKKQFLS